MFGSDNHTVVHVNRWTTGECDRSEPLSHISQNLGSAIPVLWFISQVKPDYIKRHKQAAAKMESGEGFFWKWKSHILAMEH